MPKKKPRSAKQVADRRYDTQTKILRAILAELKRITDVNTLSAHIVPSDSAGPIGYVKWLSGNTPPIHSPIGQAAEQAVRRGRGPRGTRKPIQCAPPGSIGRCIGKALAENAARVKGKP